jgi:diguanylate cyclase (GGDEF)-like protein
VRKHLSSPTSSLITRLPRLIAERRSTAVLGLVIIAMLWAAIVLKYVGDTHDDRVAAERMTQNFAMVFEENVLRTIGEIDKALLYMRRTIETRRAKVDLNTIVQTTDVLSEIIVQVAIIDADGIMRASNAGPQPAPPIDLSDREHYRVHVGRDADELFISKPLVGRASGKWSVQFTRRFLNRDGSFAGVVVASLDPEHLTEFYNKIDLGAPVAISLIGNDGVVRSAGGTADGYALGQDLKDTEVARRIRSYGNATFEEMNAASGEPSLVTIRKVRGHPLWVSVATSKPRALADSWSTLKLNALIGLALTLIILGAMDRILKSEERARLKADQLRLTLEHMSQGIMLVTQDRDIPVINQRCAELLDLPPGLVRHPPGFDALMSAQPPGGPLMNLQVQKGEPDHEGTSASAHTTVYERMTPSGRMLEVRTGSLPDGSFVQTFTDITKRWEAEAHIARLASEDPLTGLPNRRVFRSTLDRSCDVLGPAAAAGDQPVDFAVYFLDLDRFKVINDTMGHRMGDRLLQAVAKRLVSMLEPGDSLARLGGDEFALIIKSAPSRPEIEERAAAIVETIARPYEIDGCQIRSSASIGIAIAPAHGRSADELLVAADIALYAVKANHRGSYRLFEEEMNRQINERREIEVDLREALESNALELQYQSIVDLRDGRIVGFETLSRWHHPRRGMVPPSVFIPIAEDSGLIIALGRWTLIEACRQATAWPDDMRVSVNVSPVQFAEADFVETVAAAIEAAGLEPSRLELELTEGIFLENNASTAATLRRLKELGVAIALDDFGTGYSSLSYLRVFPFDKIKIDRSFVSDLGTGNQLVAVVQAVVSIARALGMTTTAEGVETDEQRAFLIALGCDQAQGWLFSRSVPAHDALRLVAEQTQRTQQTKAA